MNVAKIKDMLGLNLVGGEKGLEKEIKGGYCGDLLSNVMANAEEGCIWITVQTHQNIVAVAVLKNIAGIIITGNNMPEENTKKRADEEGIPLFVTDMNSFEIAGRLYEAGIGKIKNA